MPLKKTRKNKLNNNSFEWQSTFGLTWIRIKRSPTSRVKLNPCTFFPAYFQWHGVQQKSKIWTLSGMSELIQVRSSSKVETGNKTGTETKSPNSQCWGRQSSPGTRKQPPNSWEREAARKASKNSGYVSQLSVRTDQTPDKSSLQKD